MTRRLIVPLLYLFLALLAGCSADNDSPFFQAVQDETPETPDDGDGGDGGDGGDDGGDGDGEPPSFAVTGNAILGNILNADVTATDVSGTVVATGTTDANGDFELELPGDVSGPGKIEVTPNAMGTSTYLCDFADGCNTDSGVVAFGAEAPYTLTLSAVTPDITNLNDLNVNPITTAITARAESLGLSAETVTQADQEMATALSDALGIEIPENIASLPNVDIVNGEADATDESEAAVVVSMLTAGLFALTTDTRGIDDVVDDLTTGFSGEGGFEVSDTFNSGEVGTTELIFSLEQQTEQLIAQQPEASEAVSSLAGDLDLDALPGTLVEVREELQPANPILTGTPGATAIEGVLYSFQIDAEDPDGDVLEFSLAGGPSWLMIDTETGQISGTPTADDIGTTSGISISVDDGFHVITTDDFSITVLDVPAISGTPAGSAFFGVPYAFTPDVVDTDSQSFQFTITGEPGWLGLNATTGALSGTPALEDIGTTDSITITVTDGVTGDVSLTSFTIDVSNPAIVSEDEAITDVLVPVDIDVLANDTVNDDLAVTVEVIGDVVGGTAVVADNIVTFTPAAGFGGDGGFSYNLAYNDVNSETATVSVFVDDQPVANTDDRSFLFNTTLTSFNVLENDTGLLNPPIEVAIVPGSEVQGTAVVNADNTVSFTPPTDFLGDAEFSYTITDSDGDEDTALVTLHVTDFLAEPDDTEILFGETLTNFDALANDVVGPGVVAMIIEIDAENGAATVNEDFTVNYVPDDEFAGFDEFTYQIEDEDGDQSSAVVTVYVDDIPETTEDDGVTPGVTPLILAVLANDSGLRNEPLDVTISVDPENGTAVANEDNTVTYTPDLAFFGTDTFTYLVTDDDGDTAPGEVSVFVNDEPIATTDEADLEAGETILVAVQDNDSGLGNPPIELELETLPTFGTASIVGDEIQFETDGNFPCEGDSLQYRITDVDGDTDVGTVNISVSPYDGSLGTYGPGGIVPCNYQPPIGIPEPWGITQTHEMYEGEPGYLDAGNGPYTHYVDNTGVCSDAGDGTAAEPRCTIPQTMDAGDVVEIHGGPYEYSGRNYFYLNGTIDDPVFMRGVDDGGGYPILTAPDASFNQNFFTEGAYGIIEHLRFIDQSMNLGCRENHIECAFDPLSENLVLRFSEVRNNENGRDGVNIFMNDMTVFNNEIHHNQTENRHGLVIQFASVTASVLDNYFHHNGDNDVQYTDGAGQETQADFVYVGRNLMEHTREVGVATKWVNHTVVSENTIRNYLPTNKSEEFCFEDGSTCITPTSAGPGTGIIIGADGFPKEKWILFNRIYNTPYCIRLEEADAAYIIGNQCFNSPDPQPLSTDGVTNRGFGGIRLEARGDVVEIVHNTFYNALYPILSDFTPNFAPEIHNNIILEPAVDVLGGFTAPGHALRFTQGLVRLDTVFDSNLIFNNGDFKIFWQGGLTEVGSAAAFDDIIDNQVLSIMGTIVQDPMLENLDADNDELVDLTPKAGSPAIGAATNRIETLDALFKATFGADLTIIPEEWSDGEYDLGAVPFPEE